ADIRVVTKLKMMTNKTLPDSQSGNKRLAVKLSIFAAAISIVALFSLHILSPEFAPSWRMVSEYANGQFEWVLFIFFCFWVISSWCLTYFLWFQVSSTVARAGVVLLSICG